MHHKVLAHQVAALSIMGWLGDITEKSGQIDPQWRRTYQYSILKAFLLDKNHCTTKRTVQLYF